MNYALLVGINRYQSSKIGKLRGCKNDITFFKKYLENRFQDQIAIETLMDNEARRMTIIDTFRSHLGKAQKGDLAIFYFSGHGSREKSPMGIRAIQEDEYHETLVCFDSRNPNQPYDLADKEIKLLIHEVAENGAEVVLIIDACHSGSITRTHTDVLFPTVRQEKASDTPRPEHTFLSGSLSLSTVPKHIVFSACQRNQLARECRVPIPGKYRSHGFFSYYLLETLNSFASNISYRDIAHRCESIIHQNNGEQTPLFEAFGGFGTFSRFLDPQSKAILPTGVAHTLPTISTNTYLLTYRQDDWQVNVGILNGLELTLNREAIFAIYDERTPPTFVGMVNANSVDLEFTTVDIDDDLASKISQTRAYVAVPIILPMKPFSIGVKGAKPDSLPTEIQQLFKEYIRGAETNINMVNWVNDTSNCRYIMEITPTGFQLKWKDTGLPIFPEPIPRNSGIDPKILKTVHEILLQHLIGWERFLALSPKEAKTNVLPHQVEYKFKVLDDVEEVYLTTTARPYHRCIPKSRYSFPNYI